MKLIIGLTGPAGSGKSTIAREICAILPAFEARHIKAPLAAMLRAYYRECGLNDAEIDRRIDGDLKREPDLLLCGKTPTHAQQTLGTEWGRETIGPTIWLDRWVKWARSREQRALGAINESVRFENEAAAIRALGGVVVELTGRRDERVSSGHASEAPVRPDARVSNAPGRSVREVALDVIYTAGEAP